MADSAMTSDERMSIIRTAFREQAQWCALLGSPFTALLCSVLGDHLDMTSEVGRRVLGWTGAQPDARGDAVPLRLAGALHALVRSGAGGDLAACYPPYPLPERAVLTRDVIAALVRSEAFLLPWLDSPPQTNEVARSSQIFAGLCQIADLTGLPIALFEIGASAGLNLHCDQFAYRFGGEAYGQESATLLLEPDWKGPLPPHAPISVVSRRGCDLRPVDITQASARERLAAYVWADMAERLDRLQQALAIAPDNGTVVEAGDAGEWVERALPAAPVQGVCRVLYHTIARQYFPQATTARIDAHIARVGAAATNAAPFAWLSFEQDPAVGRPILTLTLWPGGETVTLGEGDAHGRKVRWHGLPDRAR